MQSAFRPVLADLVAELPDAHSAIFVDWEGEAIDQSSINKGKTSVRLLGAHWGVICYLVRATFEKLGYGVPREIILHLSSEQIVARRVCDDYYLLVASHPRALLSRTLRAVDLAEARLLEAM